MSTSSITPIRSNNRIEAARLLLVKKLLAVVAPGHISVYPRPSEFSVVGDHFREVLGIFDEWCASIGHEIADNSPCHVDMKLFLTPCMDSVEGNALFEIDRAIETLIEDHNEMVRSA